MKTAFIFCCSLLLIAGRSFSQDTVQKIVPNRFNSSKQQKKPYVILISVDGLRYDLADKFNAVNLKAFRESGVQAEYMQPSYPSLTFPNHYSIITGLYPSHHGIVDNTFLDRKKNAVYSLGNRKVVTDSSWYGGTPLWVLAEKQQMLAASFYWVASEAAIQGVRPTYYYTYNEAIPIDRRIEVVKNWLQLPEDKRPHLITFYFPEVDHAEHRHGVNAKETEEAVHFIDQSMGKLVAAVDSLKLPVNFILLSDHGMADLDTLHSFGLPQSVDTTKFFVPYGVASVHMYARDSTAILPTYQALQQEASGYRVYLQDSLPARFHYSKKDDIYNRAGDIFLLTNPPSMFWFSKRAKPMGEHGYDPQLPEMHATFYAWGPAFKKHKKIGGFENVNVYPLIQKILGLDPAGEIDGQLKVLKPILKK